MTNLDSILKSRDITSPTKVHLVEALVFPVVTYGCESWTIKKAESQRIDAFELWWTLESPLDCKEIQPVHPKGNQSWMFIGRTDAEAETPIPWPPDENWLIWKYPGAENDWRQEEKGTTGDEMIGWHHRLNGHGFGWTPGVGEGQWGLACCSSWGRKESEMTERLNWIKESRWFFWSVSLGNKEGTSHSPLMTITLPKHPFYFFIQFSCSVVYDSLQPHEPQHARPPCSSRTPGVHQNPFLSSRWCHPTI